MNRAVVVGALGFLIGGSSGALIGFLVGKYKYEAKADKEIAKIRNLYLDHFAPKNNENDPKKEKPSSSNETPEAEAGIKTEKDAVEYSKKYYRSDNFEAEDVKDVSTLEINNNKHRHIIIISPDEFHSSEYECKTLFYYADKILADEDNNVIHVPEEVIGDEALSSFGRYEDDCVYVRDGKLKVDYEIIYSQLTFEEHMERERERKLNSK